MSPNHNDHEAGGSSSSDEERPREGSDHDHEPPSETGGSEKPEATQVPRAEEASPSLEKEKHGSAETEGIRNERERPGPKTPEPPVNAIKSGQTDWISGSGVPLQQPEIRVRAATRAKHYFEHKNPKSELERFLEDLEETKEWCEIITEKDALGAFMKASEPGEGNPSWSQPPAAPDERVQYFNSMVRHYESRIENRAIEVILEHHAPPHTGHPLPNIQIKSNSLCLVNPPGNSSSAGIRAPRSESRDSIPETQARALDTIIAGDREMQELAELLRETKEQHYRATKDLESSRNRDTGLQENGWLP